MLLWNTSIMEPLRWISQPIWSDYRCFRLQGVPIILVYYTVMMILFVIRNKLQCCAPTCGFSRSMDFTSIGYVIVTMYNNGSQPAARERPADELQIQTYGSFL